jgi:hypothetical protein
MIKKIVSSVKDFFPEPYKPMTREMVDDALFFCRMKIKYFKVKDFKLYERYIKHIEDGSIKYDAVYELGKKGNQLHKDLIKKSK